MTLNFLKIFSAFIPDYYDQCASFFTLLSKAEQLKSQSFKFEYLKKNYIISHGLLRCLLSQFLKIIPSTIKYNFGPFGKPFVETGEILFNMSHSHNTVLYAFSDRVDLGIDIEYVRPSVTLDQLPWKFLSSIKCEVFGKIEKSQNKKEQFYKKWSKLESYLKAHGTGICCKIEDSKFDLINWNLFEIPIDKPYVGFLTYQNKSISLTPQMQTLSKKTILNILDKSK